MKKSLLLLLVGAALTGCGGTKSVIGQLSLDEGESGSVCVRGQIDLNPVPFMTSNALFVYKEHSADEAAPDC